MRIGHVGTGGTGKTKLAMATADALDLQYRPSVVREVFGEFGWSEVDQRSATPEFCWRLQKEMFDRKLYQDKYYGKDVVFDRTPIDHLTYCIYRCEEALDEKTLKEIEELARVETLKYDVVIYHPIPSWTGQADGLRENQYPYRAVIDAIMLGYLNRFEIPYIMPPMANIRVQRDSIYNYVEGLKRAQSSPEETLPVRERAPQSSIVRVRSSSQSQETAESSNSVCSDRL